MNTRRTPFDEMNRFFDQFRGDTFDWPTVRGGQETDLNLTMERTEDSYVVLADLPGFETDEIDLQYEDEVLRIEGTHEVTGHDSARSRTVRESIAVPGNVVVDEISASYHNGVLEVRLPVDSSSSAHRIDIE